MLFFTRFGLLVGLLSVLCQAYSSAQTPHQDTLRFLLEQEQQRMKDPALDRVPYERLDDARQQTLKRSANSAAQPQSAIPNVTWQERGPSNDGGRTRAILFDPGDATHKKVWAGSLMGGLWYTNDITDPKATWTQVSESWANSTITALAADPSNPQIIYAGTGDQYDYQPGGGIWKTTDGGANWTRLTATIPNSSVSSSDLASAFTYISRLAVNQSGHVFAATRYGLARSTDGGASWSKVLAPNQGIGFGSTTGNTYNDQVTDLEIGSDNTVFVAFNPSRVFRSLNANAQSWKEITPPNTTGERTELALSPTSNGVLQVMYAVSRKYNASTYSRDISWFKRSTDGGDNWSDIAIPTDAYNAMFTSGDGYYAMSLSVHPTNANRVYAGGRNWYQSADGGATWSGPLLPSSAYQHNIQFQPGSNTVVALSGDNGVLLSTNWTTATTPTVSSRNTGYRTAEVVSVSQHPTPGNPYLLETTTLGAYRQSTDGLSDGKFILSSMYGMGLTFIDEDTPGQQLVGTKSGSLYLLNTPASTYSYLASISGPEADYDSQSNTLYGYLSTTNGYSIRRVAGIGSQLTTTDLPLTGLPYGAMFIRLSKDRKALFIGGYSGKLYKLTNIDQSTLTITAIDNGAFPQYSTPSAIDIGADDNELIVTMSNFGVQSVWYTRDGGQTWTGKDQSNYGLPDMPIRSVLFNPQNRKQVLLGTELGVWSTNDITASNPSWEPTTSGMGLVRINQLRVRPSDNRITAATAGRGVFSSDALAIPYTVPSITLNSVSSTKLCAGSQVTVSFSVSGPAFNATNRFDVYVSDATGNFTNQTRIGSGTNTVITATLPTEYDRLPYGTGYRIRVVSTSPEVYSAPSVPIAIGDFIHFGIYDRLTAAGYTNYGSSSVCPGSQVTLNVRGFNSPSSVAESIQWNRNDAPISGANGSTYTAQQAGKYTVTVQQAGCSVTSASYDLYSTNQPVISIQSPIDGAPVCTGQTIPVVCTYTGDNATFQWSRDGSVISGATSYSLAISQTGVYQCIISDASCATSFGTNSINFQFGSALTASIRSARGDSTLCIGANQYVALSKVDDGTSSNTPAYFSYQWYRNNVAITGATSSTYFAYSPGLYSLSVKQGSCSTRSNGILIKAVTSLPPTIVMNGSPITCTGESRGLEALPYGAPFQWQRDGVDIAGATSYYYVASESGTYTVRNTSSNCPTTSTPLSLTFSNTIQPRITIDPSSSPGCRSVVLSQPGPQSGSSYQYQWLLNGSPLPGATYSTLTVTGAGLYALQLTKGSCSGTSNPVSVVFGTPFAQPVKPVIQRAKATALCADGAIRLICYARGTLQWKRNGQPLTNTNNTFYATQTGLYTVVATDNGCSAESDPVDIRIGEPTTAQLLGYSRIGAGQSAQLPVVLSGPAPWSFALTDGQTVQNTYQNPHILTVSPTATTSYRLAYVTNGCGYGTILGNPTAVFVSNGSADVSLQTRVSNRTPNIGDEVEYALMLTNDGPQDAAGVEVTSRLPAGLVFVGATAGALTMTDTLLRGSVGTISAGGTAELRYKARVTRAGVFATAAQVSDSQTPDPDSQPNSGTGDGQDDAATVDLRTTNGGGDLMASDNPGQTPLPSVAGNQPIADPLTADLSLALYTDTSLPQPGDVINVRVVVSNRGGSAATSVAVQTKLPDGWTMANTNNVANSQNGASTVYANEVPAGRSVTLLFIVKVGSSGGTIQSQIASVVEKDPDSTPGNGYTNGEDDTASLMIRTR